MFKTLQKKDINFALLILLLGLIIRAFYQGKYNVMLFQHDWHGHIEMIKYIANTWSIPMPNKGLEFPQQPLYYLITAKIYSLTIGSGLSEKIALEVIGYFSFVCSALFLIYSYKFIALLSSNKYVQNISMIFLALTPSIVYISARINNDSLVMALSAMALYYIVKSYQSNFQSAFYMALTLTSLLFLTKISSASIELLFFSLLLLGYINRSSVLSKKIKNRLYLFGVVGIFLLTYTLWRVYLPLDGSFHLVNSSGNYPNQSIKALDLHYFGTFHFKELFHQGYSYVFGEDKVRYSFLTYQYGTMLFGEFDYTYFINKTPYLRPVMQSILVVALLFPLGIISYLVTLHRASTLHRLLLMALLINLLLILKFMFEYSSVCNTDFRYFVTSFPIIAFIIAQGVTQVVKINKYLARGVYLLGIFEVVFFILLIM